MDRPDDTALDVMIPCHRQHVRLVRHAVDGLEAHIRPRRIYIVARPTDHAMLRERLGSRVELLDARSLIPDMTLAALEKLPVAEFPQRAGWYYQQLNKLAFGLRPSCGAHYLIWDADTVPLRPMTFFDAQGRVWFNGSAEYHLEYFENYARLLGHSAEREFSFVSEHMVVDTAILQEMLDTIDRRFPGTESWAWKIMRNLSGEGISLFSEYETYGHYVKAKHPDKAAYRFLPWTRDKKIGLDWEPNAALLAELAQHYFYATFDLFAA